MTCFIIWNLDKAQAADVSHSVVLAPLKYTHFAQLDFIYY